MKNNPRFPIRLLAIVGIILAGCATQNGDWNRRVGNFTYQQAVNELGQPAKQETLADGRVTVEWISRYNVRATSPEMDNNFYDHSASLAHIDDATRESTLSLTFSTNNVLTSWSKD
jgi:coenzyme F420-reducing hydrogenase delta subunit